MTAPIGVICSIAALLAGGACAGSAPSAQNPREGASGLSAEPAASPTITAESASALADEALAIRVTGLTSRCREKAK